MGQQASPGKRCFLIICVISLPGVFTVLPVTFLALANMLGHSSIETTRIYLVSTEDVYAKKIARLGLVQRTK